MHACTRTQTDRHTINNNYLILPTPYVYTVARHHTITADTLQLLQTPYSYCRYLTTTADKLQLLYAGTSQLLYLTIIADTL